MKTYIKCWYQKFLPILVIIVAGCGIAFAQDADDTNETVFTKQSLSPMEQRMQQLISVTFSDAEINEVIRVIAAKANLNIIKSPEVVGTVTAELADVPLEEALNNILAAHGYGCMVDKNLVRIVPIEQLTQEAERLVSKIYRITYTDVSEVADALDKFKSGRGIVSYNKGTSNIIVTDTESKVKAMDKYIAEIDRITPQILVEARIYDITSQDSLDIGIEWQAGRNSDYGISGITGLGTNPSLDHKPFATGTFSGATSKTSGTTGALRMGWLGSGIDIDTVLRAQHNKISAKLLANPRVLVLDNKPATFKIVSEIPYQELTESSQGGSMGTTSFKEVGVELRVTPHLTRDEMIRLHVQPKFSVHVTDVTFKSGSLEYPQPVVDKREADTTLLIKSGQTVVLGGLRKKEVRKQINKVPLLGDLPILGLLFRFEGEDTVTSELVVFVTPRIIERPALSEIERKQLEVTEFSGPEVTLTRAEKSEE